VIAETLQPAEASSPAEERGSGRDDVRLLVAWRSSGELLHAAFAELPELLTPGDLLVVNTSSTLPAALPAGAGLRIHLSSPAPPNGWLVELRAGDERFTGGDEGDVLALPGDASATLLQRDGRLWLAELDLPSPVPHYLARHGEPIRYRHTARDWPLESYQTVYANAPGSAEMPSAGRAFTPELITQLVAAGIDVAPLVLHTGVSSLEAGERPHAEWLSVPRFTAERARLARSLGGRVIAVGTTVVRALETVAAPDGRVEAGGGWTGLMITPERGVRAIDGLITGWHEPESSHLQLLEAVAGADLLSRSYDSARAAGYRFHEFGDSQLILP
jgi:S-adenosylmethionine:tRNA ribosyltransferase-isomerase